MKNNNKNTVKLRITIESPYGTKTIYRTTSNPSATKSEQYKYAKKTHATNITFEVMEKFSDKKHNKK